MPGAPERAIEEHPTRPGLEQLEHFPKQHGAVFNHLA
jgi:hypothetical protein